MSNSTCTILFLLYTDRVIYSIGGTGIKSKHTRPIKLTTLYVIRHFFSVSTNNMK